MKKKKYLKWWIAAVSAVFIVGAGIFVYTQYMGVVDNASDENNENTRRKATVVPIKIEYV